MRNNSYTEKNFRNEQHFYTPGQFKQYLDTARQIADEKDTLSDWGYYVFFAIAYFTGLRKGEIIPLKWSDIEGEFINVHSSAFPKVKGSSVVEMPPKNGSCRSVQMPQPLVEILYEHKERYEIDSTFSDELRVCGGDGWLSDKQIESWNKRISSEAGLPHIRIYDFRQSHAILLASSGVPEKIISQRLGFMPWG